MNSDIIEKVSNRLESYGLPILYAAHIEVVDNKKKFLGWYGLENDVIYINTMIEHKDDVVSRVILHEYGHKLFSTKFCFYTKKEIKDKYGELYKKRIKEGTSKWFPSEYSKTNYEEWFCELFSYHVGEITYSKKVEAFIRDTIRGIDV